jgi:superfamily II DNA or RNA helicase
MTSRRTREALYVHAEGKSRLSGAPLDETWEADHKVPRAAAGSDDITNLQALNADENRAKSMAQPPRLRAWQAEFLTEFARNTSPSFLLVALPGAGKTVAALSAARDWIDHDPTRRKIVVIVPTDALRNQWQAEASALFGLQLQAREFTSWKSSMVGFVLTYQGLPGHSQLWQLRCHEYEILVICDEVHHAGERNEWGFHLRESFSTAGRRLLMSGTPFRGDSTRIPFVNYDSEGVCVDDFRYDYPRAIREGVIRVVRFQHEKGIVRRLTAIGEQATELTSELEDEAAGEALRQILKPDRFTEGLLRLAHTQLLRCRETMPNAGGLVICCDQDHAQKIARQLHTITGEPAAVIVSDGDRATSTVDEFRNSMQMWVVAVRQISEGVDIKRLMVLTYLTTARTPLFFRQAVGRIVRAMGTPEDMEAYCFLPDHRALVQHAQQITEAQAQAIQDEPEDEFNRAIQRDLQPTLYPDIVLGTEHTGTAGTIIEGEALTPDDARDVANLARELGCSDCIALKVMKKYGRVPGAAQGPTPPPRDGLRSSQRPLEDQLDAARAAVDRKVKRLAFVLLPDDNDRFKKLNVAVLRFIGKRARQQYTLEDCRRAVHYLDGLTRGDV